MRPYIILQLALLLSIIAPAYSQVEAPTSSTGNLNSDKNWIISKTFDENGNVIDEKKDFFDNTGKILQSQSKVKYRKDAATIYTHVFASQPIKDVLGRHVLTTLAAPIDNSEFIYKPDFVQNGSGTAYNYKNFDRYISGGIPNDKTITPDPLGNQTVKGTLGWYYSNNNTWEPYTPTTNYPYSRQTTYMDGTGNLKRNAVAGENFKMGSGRETAFDVMPVINELNHYFQIRNLYFSASELGTVPTSINEQAVQATNLDANGKLAIAIKDKDGNTLMTARPGNSLQVTNTVVLNANGMFSATVNSTNLVLGAFGGDPVIYVYAGATLFYSGPMSQLNLSGAPAQVEVRSETLFGYQHCTDPPFNTQCTDAVNAAGGLKQIHYFQIFADNSDVTINGSYTLYNMLTETATSLLSGNKLNRGYYKLVANSGNVTLTYTNGFTDIHYNFYNQLDQLVASIAPEGVKRLLDPNSTANCIFNMSPALSDIPNVGMQYGTQKTISINATDADNNTLTISFTNLPAFASTTNVGNGQTNVLFNPTSSGNQGTYTITAQVSDGIAPLVTKTFTLVVKSSTNGAPIINNIDDFTVRQGTSITVPISAWDPDGDNMTFAIPSLPYFASLVQLGNGRCNLVVSPPEWEQGGFSVQFRATDQNSALSTKNFTIVVNDNSYPTLQPINDVYITEGQSTSFNLVANDAEMLQFFVWTPVGLPSFATFTNNGLGSATIQLSPGSTHAGYYPVTIDLDDGFGAKTSRSFIIQVCDNAPITPDKTKVPFISLYEYDVQGRMVKTITPDGGASEVVYRNDGKLRFSQDAAQKLTGRYSYVNYDAIGRVVETGEYQPDGSGIAFTSDMSVSSAMKNILENTGANGGLTTGTKNDVVTVLYDLADNSHGQSGFTQDVAFMPGHVSMTKKYSSIINNTPNSANLVSSHWFSYNEDGKPVWVIQFTNGLGYKTTNYHYDFLNRLVKKVFQKNTSAETFVHYFEYDTWTQQPYKVYTNTTDNYSTKQLLITYKYYLHGGLKRKEVAGTLQGIDYTYTLHGALKAINNSDKTGDPGADGPGNGFGTDAFGMVLDYFPDDYVNSRPGIQTIKGVNTSGIGADSYIGTIKSMTWYSKKPPIVGLNDNPTTYIFQYDDKNQFTESTWGNAINFSNTPASFYPTTFNKESIKLPSASTPGYDANGNIRFLQRTDFNGALADKLEYRYYTNSNRLQQVIDDANVMPETHASYVYNATGQLTFENTGAPNLKKFIKYDASGRVVAVARDAAFSQMVVEYEYNESGNRIKKKLYNPSYQLNEITYYLGEVIYTQPAPNGIPGIVTAQEYDLKEGGNRLGVFYRASGVYAYELSDHTGNVRAVIAQNVSGYEVRYYSDYYPFGKVLQKGGTDHRYGFQGQYAEKDPETDWNNFELRMYDSHIGRWLARDPYNQFSSPYLAMGNSPVNGVDPNGGFWEELKNWLAYGYWMSNEGWERWKEYEALGWGATHEREGNRLTGYGIIKFNFPQTDTWIDPDYLVEELIYGIMPLQYIDEPVQDFFFTDMNGNTYASYIDLEFKMTAGLRASLEIEGYGFDLNLFSIELMKYSFAEGYRDIFDGFDKYKDFRFEQGLSIGAGAAKVGFKVEYDMGMQNVQTSINARLGLLDIKTVYKAMSDNVASFVSIRNNLEGSAHLIAGAEAKFGMKVVGVPNNDIQAFMAR